MQPARNPPKKFIRMTKMVSTEPQPAFDVLSTGGRTTESRFAG